MKKLLNLSLVAGLLLPGLAFAAADDVSLAVDTVISVNSITVNVSGATSTIESIEVGSTSFSVTLPAGSSFEATAPSLNVLSTDNTLWQTAATTCTGSASVLGYNNPTGDEITVTITPSATLCANATVPTSTSKGDARGGGGGAPAAAAVDLALAPLLAQIAALQAQIAALSGLPSTASPVAQTVVGAKTFFTTNLSKGSRGAIVKALQQFLNTHGFVIASSGPGSVGNETDMFGSLTVQAVQKFQEQYGIATPGAPGYGTVGPKTRAKINELSQ